jgi:hypothetical protein
MSKPYQIRVTADVHQNVEMFAAFGFSNEDGVECFGWGVTA